MTDIGWGELSDSEGFGTLGDTGADHKLISKDDISSYSDYQHAAHGMIFSRAKRVLWNLYDTRATVMMQMRFDGVLGFPGGLVDAGENPVEGLNREMQEEIGLDLSKNKFDDSHHLLSHVHEGKKLVLHFYAMEVSEEVVCSLEQKCLSAPEYGIETLGSIRVPLYTMGDGIRGFPAFLANQFAGNSKEQLITGLISNQILKHEEIRKALQGSLSLTKGAAA